MAIGRKRKEPSAGTDESEDDHQEDGGPSKKTATQFLNVKYKIFPIFHRAVLAGTSLQQVVQAGKSSTSV